MTRNTGRAQCAHTVDPCNKLALNHTVKLPRCRKLASYSRQFITLCFCLGM